MKNYIVLYRDGSLLPVDAPLAFSCMANNTDHAEEQCDNAYPNCKIVWVFEGKNVQSAYNDYWNVGNE